MAQGRASASVRIAGMGLFVITNGLVANPSYSQDESPSIVAAPVVVTGTRAERSSFDLPMSIDQIDKRRITEGQIGVNASETLVSIPGVVANNRQNYAQDLQISIRGFGSRSTFGVRGVRLYADGIPLTMPDGQGQAANVDLLTAKSIEVLRGPFSALYGNSSGGVISFFTEDGQPGFNVMPYFSAGSFDTTKYGLKIGGQQGAVNYVFNTSRFDTNGFRDYSAATRDTANGKLTIAPDDYSKVTIVMNYLMQPDTQDPQGLTRQQVADDPRQAGLVAGTLTSRDYGVRKSIDNSQAGVVYERKLNDNNQMRAMLYAGDRQVQQFLGVTPGAQNPATNGGGVIDLDRQFAGVDLRWIHTNSIADRPLNVAVGINYDRQEELRRGWNNFTGTVASPVLGTQGALRREENNLVYNFDQYVQADYSLSKRFSLSAGLRNSRVRFSSKDNFVAAGNPDDSGSLSFGQVSPVAGLVYKLSPLTNLYASFGRGFETPTFAELAYRPSGAGAGLNTDLKANRTTNYELGVKAYVGDNTRVNAAIFQANSDNEIGVLTNSGGRAVFQNVGKTTRRGVELAADSRFNNGLYVLASATWLEATFDRDFLTCEAVPCSTPTVPVSAGNRVPGIPRYTLFGELGWRNVARGINAAIEARRSGKVFVNDTNSDAASGFTLVNARVGFSQDVWKIRFTEFVRVDNIFDVKYIGSVIVNETSRRFFEPSPGRSFIAGVSASVTF